MSPTNKKIIGGVIALLFIVSIVNTQAIVKIAKNMGAVNNAPSATVAKSGFNNPKEEERAFAENQTAQVFGPKGGGGSCPNGLAVSVVALPTYSIADGDNIANIYQFSVTNPNTSPTCIATLTGFDFINLNATNANRNFEKLYLMDVATNTSIPDQNNSAPRFIPGINREYYRVQPANLTLAAGQSVQLFLQAEYIRNTNINEEPGYAPMPEDYFLTGLSKITAEINGLPANVNFVPARFDKKPVMVN